MSNRKPPQINDLKQFTDEFFRLFWRDEFGSPPEWSGVGVLTENHPSNTDIPNENLPGCYAFLDGDEVIYIGKALSPCDREYPWHGIGLRIKEHWKNGREGNFITIGFPKDEGANFAIRFISLALEAYLIWYCKPRENKIGNLDWYSN